MKNTYKPIQFIFISNGIISIMILILNFLIIGSIDKLAVIYFSITHNETIYMVDSAIKFFIIFIETITACTIWYITGKKIAETTGKKRLDFLALTPFIMYVWLIPGTYIWLRITFGYENFSNSWLYASGIAVFMIISVGTLLISLGQIRNNNTKMFPSDRSEQTWNINEKE